MPQLSLLEAGESVLVETTSAQHRGRLLDVTFNALLLDVGAAKPLRLVPETVRQIVPHEA